MYRDFMKDTSNRKIILNIKSAPRHKNFIYW